MTGKQRLVVIGNGIAGGKFVEELLARNGREHFDIVAFGDERYGSYNRILLSNVLAGSHQLMDLLLNSIEWYGENGVVLHAGVRVEAVDRAEKIVVGTGGIQESYDRLVFATGSRPFVPPIEGLTIGAGGFLPGVFVFRTLDDAFRIMEYAANSRKAVVLGGGLLGLEAARGLLNHGVEVDVVEFMPHLMAVQLDLAAGDVLRSVLEKMGIRIHLGKSISAVSGTEKLDCVKFSDGTIEPCDMLVVSAGIRPNVDIAKRAGLAVERAIVVGDDLASINDSSVYAIGECAQHRGQTYGLAAPCLEQAKVLADRLSRANTQAVYTGSSTSTTLKVMGVDLVVVGKKEPTDDNEQVFTYAQPRRGIYKKAILRHGSLTGAIMLGDASIAARLLRAFNKKETVPENPVELFFSDTSAKQIYEVEEDSGEDVLKEVIAIIRPEQWLKTKLRLEGMGIFASTHHRVVGRGKQRGLQFLARRGAPRGTGIRFLPKRMVSWIVPETRVETLVQAIMEVNRTGQIGDGKIFVLPLGGTAEIHQGELAKGEAAENLLVHA